MDGTVRCDVCGLSFNDKESMLNHRRECSREVFDMMLRDVGKWYVTADGMSVDRILSVESCFYYNVRAVTVVDDDDGYLCLKVCEHPTRLSSDTEWREIDPKTAVMEVTRAFQTMLENLF